MTKSDLIQELTKDTGMTANQSSKVVNKLLDVIAGALQRGEEVRITGFGTFRTTETKERPGRTPRTGEEIQIPAGRRVTFAAGSGLMNTVRRGEQRDRAA